MSDAAQLHAHDIEAAGAGGGEPDVAYGAGNHVHFYAELGYREIVQHVPEAQQHLHWSIQWQTQVLATDQDVIGTEGVVRAHAKRVFSGHEAGVDLAQFAVSARETIAPLPLFAEHLYDICFFRHIDEIGPYKQPRRQHCDDAHGGNAGEPFFQRCIFRFIVRLSVGCTAIAEYRQRHEQVDRNENKAGDPQGNVDGRVDRAPVGGQRRKPPGTQPVKDQ